MPATHSHLNAARRARTRSRLVLVAMQSSWRGSVWRCAKVLAGQWHQQPRHAALRAGTLRQNQLVRGTSTPSSPVSSNSIIIQKTPVSADPAHTSAERFPPMPHSLPLLHSRAVDSRTASRVCGVGHERCAGY
ncbi:hypothetical protein L1887_63107 [Cichorium endivia]|nr:hypothetical protein L1887_63107 [Cichorium endivia]